MGRHKEDGRETNEGAQENKEINKTGLEADMETVKSIIAQGEMKLKYKITTCAKFNNII